MAQVITWVLVMDLTGLCRYYLRPMLALHGSNGMRWVITWKFEYSNLTCDRWHVSHFLVAGVRLCHSNTCSRESQGKRENVCTWCVNWWMVVYSFGLTPIPAQVGIGPVLMEHYKRYRVNPGIPLIALCCMREMMGELVFIRDAQTYEQSLC